MLHSVSLSSWHTMEVSLRETTVAVRQGITAVALGSHDLLSHPWVDCKEAAVLPTAPTAVRNAENGGVQLGAEPDRYRKSATAVKALRRVTDVPTVHRAP